MPSMPVRRIPEWSLQMLDVRFTNALQAEFLD
jgi:hypothetical protein